MSTKTSNTSLFTKHRPKQFKDVIGQDHILSILKNILIKKTYDRVLGVVFGGNPGSGKTTTARLFAKAKNCLDLKNGDCCDVCKHCVQFNQEAYPDFIEVDGASFNTLDDIKKLIDIAKLNPIVKGGTRAILIDEAHRLSNAAWDTLLKVLEEGGLPSQFLFATTEPDKIRPAIVSRCYDFRVKPLTVKEIALEMKRICKSEGIGYDEDSLMHIASVYKGKTRDALKVLDMYANSLGSIVGVRISTAEDSLLSSLLKAYNGNIEEAFEIVDEMNTIGLHIDLVLSNLLTTLYVWPRMNLSNVEDKDIEHAYKLIGKSSTKDIISLYSKYKPNSVESYKQLLVMVMETGFNVSKSTKEASKVTRRLRGTTTITQDSNVKLEEYKSPEELRNEELQKERESVSKIKKLKNSGFE